MEISFQHRQSAHCETGTIANLLSHYGIQVSEAMAFGIGSGLFFGYLPFIRLNGLPLTAYRSSTGSIMKKVSNRLGVRVCWSRYKNRPEEAMEALDRLLEKGEPVGCRTGAYWLPYFPPAYRFHFNMHNIVVFGKQNGNYRVSDPVMPEAVECPEKDLARARFAKGALAPHGKMFYIDGIPDRVDFRSATTSGIRGVCNAMLKAPGPFLGTKGMRFLSGRIRKWPGKLGERKASLYIGQMIRMQEEIGTGGGGFRFIFAAFLQESAAVLQKESLEKSSARMTEIGDRWRDFALVASRICKGRKTETDNYETLSRILSDCARMETEMYKELLEIIKT
jgi:hypothetical protein